MSDGVSGAVSCGDHRKWVLRGSPGRVIAALRVESSDGTDDDASVVATEAEVVRHRRRRAPTAAPRRSRDRCRTPDRPWWFRRSAGCSRCSIASNIATASSAPAAPRAWPVTPLVDVIGTPRGTEHLGDRGGLGRIVERGRCAVGVDLADVAGLEAGVGERQPHARDCAGTARRRRGDVVGVGVARRAQHLADDRWRHGARPPTTPRASNTAAPSPSTKPSRSTSNGRLEPDVDSAVMLPKLTTPTGHPADSVPPVTTASHMPHAIRRAAYPMACVDAAHAVVIVSFGPCRP